MKRTLKEKLDVLRDAKFAAQAAMNYLSAEAEQAEAETQAAEEINAELARGATAAAAMVQHLKAMGAGGARIKTDCGGRPVVLRIEMSPA